MPLFKRQDDPKALFDLGVVYRDQGNYSEAISNFKKVLNINPNNEGAWNSLGNVYETLGSKAEAVRCFDNATKLAKNGGNLMDEDIILTTNVEPGPRRIILLTHTKLTFLKKEGVFKTRWVLSREIPLEDIEEAYVNTKKGILESSTLKLRMKNGEVQSVGFNDTEITRNYVSSSESAWEAAAREKTLCDRWASAINNQLRKPPTKEEVLS